MEEDKTKKDEVETPETNPETPVPEKDTEAETTVPAKELEAIKQDYDALLEEKDRQYAAMKAEYEAKFAEMKTAADAQHADAEKLAAVAEENETLKARIAELEASAKTAEQIAAEKYGAGLPTEKDDDKDAVDVPALKAEWERVKADAGPERQRWIRNLSEAQFKALFG